MKEDEMVGWHHQLNGYEFGQTPGAGKGQGSLVCCSQWGRIGSDTTERLNNSNTHTLPFAPAANAHWVSTQYSFIVILVRLIVS